MIVKKITNQLYSLRQQVPLIHQITNYVTVNDCANITLAIGASPVMAQDINESAEMVSHAKALVLNIGTLSSTTVESMIGAGKMAKQLSIPIVFDPVGVGATKYRTEVARRIMHEVKPDIIRCNMSELKVLCHVETAVKGVDSAADDTDGMVLAKQLAAEIDGIVAVTGKVDMIASNDLCCTIENGHAFLTRVTGTGCMTTALVASYCAVGDKFIGAVAGIMSMGIAGEIAAELLEDEEGIGTFKVHLMDAVFNLNGETIKRYAKIQMIE